MPISGYDPDDVDDALEAALDQEELGELLTEEELAAYRAGDQPLVELLDKEELQDVLERDESSLDAADASEATDTPDEGDR